MKATGHDVSIRLVRHVRSYPVIASVGSSFSTKSPTSFRFSCWDQMQTNVLSRYCPIHESVCLIDVLMTDRKHQIGMHGYISAVIKAFLHPSSWWNYSLAFQYQFKVDYFQRIAEVTYVIINNLPVRVLGLFDLILSYFVIEGINWFSTWTVKGL